LYLWHFYVLQAYWLSEVLWNKPDPATVGRSISLIARLADWGLPLQKVAAATRRGQLLFNGHLEILGTNEVATELFFRS
jgi:hypothetical protein